MYKEITRKFFSGIFLFIFFLKMMICVAPLVANHFDKDSTICVIMQLEIESSAKESDIAKDKVAKELYTTPLVMSFLNPTLNFFESSFLFEKNNHLRSFYPTVLTPPPNV